MWPTIGLKLEKFLNAGMNERVSLFTTETSFKDMRPVPFERVVGNEIYLKGKLQPEL